MDWRLPRRVLGCQQDYNEKVLDTVRGLLYKVIMTPEALFRSVGLRTIKRVSVKTGLSRQLCYLLWHNRQTCGREAAIAIHESTDLPLGTIFAILNGPPKRKRKSQNGRKKKHK